MRYLYINIIDYNKLLSLHKNAREIFIKNM